MYITYRGIMDKDKMPLETAEIIDKKAEEIYDRHKEEWEKLYHKKIVAIDIDNCDLVAVGENAGKVGLEARRKRLNHRIFMRRVGKDPAVMNFR